jgi:hypothetical protein
MLCLRIAAGLIGVSCFAVLGCGGDDPASNDAGAGAAAAGSGGGSAATEGSGAGNTGGSGASGGAGGGGRTGLVGLSGNSLVDDGGPFNAVGATMMWAAWGYKFDKERLEQNLEFLSQNGFHYVRALGVVGHPSEEDYWDGREIDWHWPDYADVIAGLTDLAFDKYGLRVEWTLIGDGQKNIPDKTDRYALIDTFVAMSQGREEKIIHFELANEAWQNGFEGDQGLADLRELTMYMKGATDILVAASAPVGVSCSDWQAVYSGDVADLATIHFDRDIHQAEGSWRPVHLPWGLEECDGIPVGSNNEPIGPGASVNTEDDPLRLASAAISTFVSNLPLYVFHSGAGVRGDQNLWDMAGANAFAHVTEIVPADLASWQRKDPTWADAPLRFFAGEGGMLYSDVPWMDLGAPESGVVRAYGSVKDDRFFVFPIGILNEVVLEARQAVAFDVVDPISGQVVSHHDLAAGEQMTLGGGEAFVLAGTLE